MESDWVSGLGATFKAEEESSQSPKKDPHGAEKTLFTVGRSPSPFQSSSRSNNEVRMSTLLPYREPSAGERASVITGVHISMVVMRLQWIFVKIDTEACGPVAWEEEEGDAGQINVSLSRGSGCCSAVVEGWDRDMIESRWSGVKD